MYLVFLIVFYLLINIPGTYYCHKFLKRRLKDDLSVWLFSISLSLSVTFFLVLFLLSLVLNYNFINIS